MLFPPGSKKVQQVTLMQSVKGKVQSAAEGTNYSEPGMTFIGGRVGARWTVAQVWTNKTE